MRAKTRDEAISPPVVNHPCTACQHADGEADDHPMIHLGPGVNHVISRNPDGEPDVVVVNPSFHFDCLPLEYERLLRDADGNALPQHATTVAAIDAARSGIRGSSLREFIGDHDAENGSDNEIEPEAGDE